MARHTNATQAKVSLESCPKIMVISKATVTMPVLHITRQEVYIQTPWTRRPRGSSLGCWEHKTVVVRTYHSAWALLNAYSDPGIQNKRKKNWGSAGKKKLLCMKQQVTERGQMQHNYHTNGQPSLFNCMLGSQSSCINLTLLANALWFTEKS